MSFYSAFFAWLIVAGTLVAGIVLATKGSMILLVLGLLAFFFAFSKWGCASHD